MPERNTPEQNAWQPPAPGEVRDRTIRPTGLLPKNAQTWVILAITVVMVGAIAFSGGGSAKQTAPATQKSQAVIDPSLARIQEYRNRIDEQANKLAAEQAQLEQTKRALGLSTPAQATMTGAPAAAGYPAYSQPAPAPAPQRPEKNPIEAEKEKREYQSLFASNIALTYRKDSEPAVPVSATTTPALAYPFLYPPPQPVASSPATPRAADDQNQDATVRSTAEVPKEELQREHRPIDPGLQKADGKSFRLLEGTIIETVLTNRLDGSFNGPVNCLVTTDVYSHDLQHVLIPRGSRVLGEVRRNDTFGQQRLAVVFHRIIMPDGYSASLDQFKGLSQVGETGLRDQVNHHYGQIFGVSLAIGALAGLSNINTGYGFNASTFDAYREGVGASLSQSSLRILDRYLNVLPTFTIREGHRVKVVLSDDLLLPAYERHKMPPDF